MTPLIQVELGKLPENLREYARLSGKTEDETIAKKSSDLTWALYHSLKAIAPRKGQVMAERLAALKAGGGVKVRGSVMEEIATKYGALTAVASGKTWLEVKKGKRVTVMAQEINGMNLQALAVKRELALRESGRGFSAYSSPRPQASEIQGDEFARIGDRQTASRYGFVLSDFRMRLGDNVEVKYSEMRWFGAHGDYNTAAEALATPKQQARLAEAARAVNEDIGVYLKRKLDENAKRAHLA